MASRMPGPSDGGSIDPQTLARTNHEPPVPTGQSFYDRWSARRVLIETICGLTSDRWTLEVARFVTMKGNGHASAHLDYYLGGMGGTLEVDLAKVIKDDEGVRKKLNVEIMSAMLDGKLEGTVSIPQHVYSNPDWLYALGGINLNWRAGPPLAPGKVRVGFRNTYRWHPEASDRVSQCVHQAAVRLQSTAGAKDYVMEGWTLITPSVDEWSNSSQQNAAIKK